LTALATWLERNGHADAAASVREGLEETLTVLKLGLPPTLRRFFATTNCIENLIGTLRHVTRNIKRWRDGDMRRRWIGLGLLRAAARFRCIKHHGELGALVTALGTVTSAERGAWVLVVIRDEDARPPLAQVRTAARAPLGRVPPV